VTDFTFPQSRYSATYNARCAPTRAGGVLNVNHSRARLCPNRCRHGATWRGPRASIAADL